MQKINMPSMEDIKTALDSMDIPYKEVNAPENQLALIRSFHYDVMPLTVDLTHKENVDAETGTVVYNMDSHVDNGIYIFTVLHSGQAGFIVVIPSTISRAPLVRKVSGDIISAINGIDMPPLTPFDMMEITAHMLTGTFMKLLTESVHIPKECEKAFLRIYLPKFLANVGVYFTGATTEEGEPLIYEEIVNMEPMMVWNALQKGANGNEGGGAGESTGEDTEEKTGTEGADVKEAAPEKE